MHFKDAYFLLVCVCVCFLPCCCISCHAWVTHSLTPPLVVPKPREIRQWEKEKRKRDRGFFQDMEENILASLQRNERIPGISSSSPSSVLSVNDLSSPTANLQQQQPISHDEKETMLTFHKDTNTEDDNDKGNMSATTRPKGGIRTISGMDERTLADLYNSAVAGHSHKNDQEMKKKKMMMTKKKDYEGRDDERPLVVRDIINHHLMQKQPQQLSLRPPLPPRGQQQQQQRPEDMDVAAAATKAHDLNTAQVSSTYSSKDGSSTSNNSVSSNDQDMNNNTMSHIRHHSESASYTSPTMINPNVAATIQSVCGVCRVHLVEHWQQAQQARQDRPHTPASCFPYTPLSWSMMKATTNAAVVGLFRDDDSYYNTSHQQYRGENASRLAVAAANNNNNKPIPSIDEMVRFYSDFYETSKMQQDTIIMSLIYLERLMKYTNGALVPTPENWRSLLLSCMTLASKVWDDLSMWNVDFSFVAASTSASGLANFSLQRINRLEVALLSSLMFDVRVTASEYAKYYFLIRTMMIRSTQSSSSSSSSHETATAMRKTKTTSSEHKRSSSTATAPAKQYHPDHPPLKKSREHYKSETSTRIPSTAAAPSKSRRWTEDFWVSVPTAVTNTSTATTTAAAAAAMDCFTPSYSSRRSMASVLAH